MWQEESTRLETTVLKKWTMPWLNNLQWYVFEKIFLINYSNVFSTISGFSLVFSMQMVFGDWSTLWNWEEMI